ncbi:MAG TPA: sulfatase/phosphatase domain-containing protein, partial [Rubrobacter sp.]|nr:sulfatase/phosphatase domain-containing protein [Rubrobacter sp.]
RTSRYNYVEYDNVAKERELYDLDEDPTELTNIYKSASPALISSLSSRLDALKVCAGADTSATSCRTAEDDQ